MLRPPVGSGRPSVVTGRSAGTGDSAHPSSVPSGYRWGQHTASRIVPEYGNAGIVHKSETAATSGTAARIDRLRVDSAFDAAIQSVEYGANRRLAVVSGRESGADRQVLAAAVAGAHGDRNDHAPRTHVRDGN